MKILNIGYKKRIQIEKALEDAMESHCDGEDYIYICEGVADECKADSLVVEHIFDDLYVNNHQEWDCKDQYDEDELLWDDDENCYIVKEDEEF